MQSPIFSSIAVAARVMENIQKSWIRPLLFSIQNYWVDA
jgi:hypothetical protein